MNEMYVLKRIYDSVPNKFKDYTFERFVEMIASDLELNSYGNNEKEIYNRITDNFCRDQQGNVLKVGDNIIVSATKSKYVLKVGVINSIDVAKKMACVEFESDCEDYPNDYVDMFTWGLTKIY